MEIEEFKVPAEKLRWQCDSSIFEFECTKDLAPLREFIGQDRAIRSLEFGLNMPNHGYNIFVSGVNGTGKTSMVKAYVERVVREREAKGEKFDLEDWCYLYNFKEPDAPSIVSLPKGIGSQLRQDMTELLEKIRTGLGQAFSSDDYKEHRKKTIQDVQTEQQKLFQELSSEARQQGFLLQMSPSGPMLIPMKDDRPMEEQEYLALDEKTRNEIDARQTQLRTRLQEGIEAASNVQNQAIEKLKQMDREIAEYTVHRLFTPLLEHYGEWSKVADYLNGLKDNILENLEPFKGEQEEQVNPVLGIPMSRVMGGNPFLPFEVNVFIDRSGTSVPPVVVESNPNFGNVFGKTERKFLFGGYLSDHTMLKAGSLARADGGYLLLDATDVLTNPYVWPALKRAIRNREVRIEEPFEQFGLVATQGMRPEPMPINVKVILTGDPNIYQLLSMYDEDFWEIFKVKADFDVEIAQNRDNLLAYAAFLSGCCEECETLHFDASGVAKLLEYSARAVADQERLSTRFALIKDWIQEASYWAARDNARYISAQHVQKAMDEKRYRHDLPDARLLDMINRGTIMIDVDKAVVGQVNGLSVYSLGDITFGKPSRITAKTFLGRSGVINIERESQLSGPIHNKGVMILSGYLGWKYAQDKPLSLSASLCFEQSYSGVEGDSASSAELYAILSSLSEAPIKQNLAVTGSVNQKGEIQPIGGVNQKIEGFFRVCQARGLTGNQGVLIPHTNLKNLMIIDEVIEAVKAGQFNVYAARTIDEGIQILTGVPAGERAEDGTYPEGTINYLVSRKLGNMAERLRDYMAEEKKEEKPETIGAMHRDGH